jgi:Zn-dependent peptidase ImmA (M78 family)/DNA-binding XRE family transcriptional regulator
MTKIMAFNGEKLRLARLLNGLTQQELGTKITVSRQFVHQMESDLRSPADDVLSAITEVLHVEPEFFLNSRSNDVKFEQCHFRKRKTTPVGIARRVLAFSTIFEQLVEFLNNNLNLPDINFPSVEQSAESYSNADIEKAAGDCRKLWELGTQPISHITRALENAGVIITQYKDVSEKVDALSVNRRYPIIVRNNAKKSICRMRFDLAHECGHFVLHDGIETGNKATESEANRFASAFIFPRSSFIQEFPNFFGSQRLDWNLIYNLKVKWGMSARAIIYKAHYYELISAQQFRGANVYLNKSGQTKVEKFDNLIRSEEPEMLRDIFRLLTDQQGMDFSYLAHKLQIDVSMLSLITGFNPDEFQCSNNLSPIT